MPTTQKQAALAKTEELFHSLVTPPITSGKLLLQVKADFWAKEVQTGYTYSYVWMANQFGHFNLGFLPSLLPAVIGAQLAPGSALAIWAGPLLVFAFWFNKERGDVTTCVRDTDGRVFAGEVDRRHIWLDALTAVLFFGLGGLVAALAVMTVWFGVVAFLLGLVPAFFAARYWLERRLFFQQSSVPFIYRLALFPGRFESPAGEDAVLAFRRRKLKHLIVTGSEGSGKTTLNVALGTELAFDRKIVRMISLMKLLDYIDGDEPPLQAGHLLWPWEKAEWLLVDDVGVDVPAPDGRRTVVPAPEQVLRALADKQAEICSKRTLWAIAADGSDADAWISGIEQFLREGDPSNAVGRANLAGNLQQNDRARAATPRRS